MIADCPYIQTILYKYFKRQTSLFALRLRASLLCEVNASSPWEDDNVRDT